MKTLGKKSKQILVAIILLIALTGCTSNQGNEEIKTSRKQNIEENNTKTVTVWCWDKNYNGVAVEEAAKIYEADNPNVEIQMVVEEFWKLEERFTTAVKTGRMEMLPDILLMQDRTLTKYLSSYTEIFRDLTDSEIDFSKFVSFKEELGKYNGRNYGLPFDSGAAIACYRTDILREAGFTIDDFTDITWSDFIEKGKVVLNKTGKPMMMYQEGSADLTMLMLQSAGGSLFQNGKPDYTNNETLKEALDIYTEMVKSGILVEVNDWNEYTGGLKDSAVASTINGCWVAGTVSVNEEQSGLWEVTTIPRLVNAENATNYSNQGGASWLVIDQAEHADLAVDFLKETFASSVELYDAVLTKAGAVGTYLQASEAKSYTEPQAFFNNQKVYAMIADYATKVPPVGEGNTDDDARTAMGIAVTNIIHGMDMEEALKKAMAR